MDSRNIAIGNLQKAFRLWEERYRADPSNYMNESRVGELKIEDYGELAANYLVSLLDEISAKNNKGE